MAVVYPEGTWYAALTPDDVPEIVERSTWSGGEPVERLRYDPETMGAHQLPARRRTGGPIGRRAPWPAGGAR